MYRDCPRKWAWRYLLGLKPPQHPAAALGDEVDSGQLQPYLREGRPIDLTKQAGQIAAAALPYLPLPQTPGLVLQKEFHLPAPTWEQTGLWFTGFIDLWAPDSKILPGCAGGVPGVTDFKRVRLVLSGRDQAAAFAAG